jgi:anti-anti-sigma regulatory factor
MTFRIETAARGGLTVFILSSRIEAAAIAELRRFLELQTDYRNIVIDLKDVSLVGRDVLGFLARCEVDGVKIENCPRYIREWIEREKD